MKVCANNILVSCTFRTVLAVVAGAANDLSQRGGIFSKICLTAMIFITNKFAKLATFNNCIAR